jgi:hypothetical protein
MSRNFLPFEVFTLSTFRFIAAPSGETTRMSLVDYYAVLNVSVNASVTEIRNSYRRLALEHHPGMWFVCVCVYVYTLILLCSYYTVHIQIGPLIIGTHRLVLKPP